MMAAVSAAEAGAKVVLLERNEKLGKKLYITGKGRCNVTNSCGVDDLIRHVAANPKFLYSAFYAFDSLRLMNFLEKEGLRLKTERGNRVFPSSDKSSDVIRTFESALKKRGVDVRLYARVKKIIIEDGEFKGVRVACGQNGKNKEIDLFADAAVIATGGMSYPSTGSTGDGYAFAREAGHDIKEPHPSLVPISIKEDFVKGLQGLSLRNVGLALMDGKKKLYDGFGEMIFTHFGISGPLVLTASSFASGKDVSKMRVCIDLKPALTKEQLNERISRDFSEYKNLWVKNALKKLLPMRLIPVIADISNISLDKRAGDVSVAEKKRLADALKRLELSPTGFRGFDEAIITRGGVNVREINPSTMESKKVKGMYFAGEVADVDAATGGYNLQIAWSTGYLAGASAAGGQPPAL